VSAWLAGVLAALSAWTLLAPLAQRASARRPVTQHGPMAAGGELDLVDVAEQIARETRAGAGAQQSIIDALARAPSFAPAVSTAMSRHASLTDALTAHRPHGDERDLVVHALRIGIAHTHVLPSVLDRAVVIVRERRAWRLERHAQAAQARASARVLTVLPLVFAVWGAVSSPSVRDAYATSTVTAAVATVGVVLNLAGWWWMGRVVGSGR